MMKGRLLAHADDRDVVQLLAFIGGFVDAAGWIKISGVFVASITGNLVVACAVVSNPYGVVCRVLVTLSFAAAAGVCTIVAMKLRNAYKYTARSLAIVFLSLEIGLLAIVWGVGLYFEIQFNGSVDLNNWKIILVGSLMGASMGLHNAAAKENIPNCPATTVMTTTLVNISCALSKTAVLYLSSISIFRLTPPTGPDGSYLPLTNEEQVGANKATNDSLMAFLVLFKPLLSFLLGAVMGGITMIYISFYSMFVPIFMLLVIIADICIAAHRERSQETLPVSFGTISPTSTSKPTDTSHHSSTVVLELYTPTPHSPARGTRSPPKLVPSPTNRSPRTILKSSATEGTKLIT